MPKLTDITTQKRKDTRVSLFLDGRFYCGMEKLTVLRAGLRIGDEIDEQTLAQLQAESESGTAFEKAAGYLSTRMRTEAEMRRYLTGKGYVPQVVDGAIDKLKAYRYLDDALFCKQYIEQSRARYGEKRLRLELRRLGVEACTIDDALEALGDQTEDIRAAADKYLRTHAKADRQKLYAFLYGKGFAYEGIKTVLCDIEEEGYWDEPNDEDDSFA